MAKRREERPKPTAPPYRPPQQFHMFLRVATLVGVAVLIFIHMSDRGQNETYRQGLEDRLAKIETSISAVSSKVDAASLRAAAPTQRRSGPDPDKVYPVKTDGAPIRGAARAPITIAEFSDFQ